MALGIAESQAGSLYTAAYVFEETGGNATRQIVHIGSNRIEALEGLKVALLAGTETHRDAYAEEVAYRIKEAGNAPVDTYFQRIAFGGKEKVATNAASGAAATVDLANGNVHKVTLTANCTLTLAGALSGVHCELKLLLVQDATGSRLVTWPASVKWPGGTAPTLTTGVGSGGKTDLFTLFTLDGGTTWYGKTEATNL